MSLTNESNPTPTLPVDEEPLAESGVQYKTRVPRLPVIQTQHPLLRATFSAVLAVGTVFVIYSLVVVFSEARFSVDRVYRVLNLGDTSLLLSQLPLLLLFNSLLGIVVFLSISLGAGGGIPPKIRKQTRGGRIAFTVALVAGIVELWAFGFAALPAAVAGTVGAYSVATYRSYAFQRLFLIAVLNVLSIPLVILWFLAALIRLTPESPRQYLNRTFRRWRRRDDRFVPDA
ncbi:MAG: hypothetical protein KF726_14445 [Anaerolineae bacterium]|nr:hypothetical protein [Anaerolineae bacterium]